MGTNKLFILICLLFTTINANKPRGSSHHQKLEGLRDGSFNIMGDEDDEIEAFNARVDEEIERTKEAAAKGL